MDEFLDIEAEQLDRYRWRLPRRGAMKVDGLVYANPAIFASISSDQALRQVANVAALPGVVGASLAMPDAHWGYGFPIGGVAAMDADEGVVSPGGVGYDINCGVRLMSTRLEADEVREELDTLLPMLFNAVPSGVGSKGAIHLKPRELKKALTGGMAWARAEGLADDADVENTEDHGQLDVEGFGSISDRAFKRGADQLGTLGGGNHFIELQRVERVYDPEAADTFGLREGQLVVMLHSGSRGFGYQVCDDFLKKMSSHTGGLELPDRQLACARLGTDTAREYLNAMNAAANYAFVNRQVMMTLVRDVLGKHFGHSGQGARLVYDVSHNIAKFERHTFEGKSRRVLVHRKGATRAFGPGRDEVPARYRAVGQPVLIPGDMGSASYVLRGTERAMAETFGSTCHGAGRVLSRTAALKLKSGQQVRRELEDAGIRVMSKGIKTLAEEMPEAYKDVDEVVETVDGAGIAAKVARLKPIAVIKG